MSANPGSFKVYDTETTGLSAHFDQVIQFAGVTLDSDLNIIPGEDLVLDIAPRLDVVPNPYAFAVHGISLRGIAGSGALSEFEAAGIIRNWFLKRENSMIAGFNSLSFDDEVIRNMMYRTMLDPYEHEWKNSNGRLDVLRLVYLVYALRPELMSWPVNEEGKVSLKLGDLCRANGITLDHAHDARFDVMATVELMRLVKNKSPRLWDYYLNLTTKDFCRTKAEQLKPLVLVDRYIPREQGHMSIVLPIIYDSKGGQKMLCVDLREHPAELLSLSADELHRRIFTPLSELAEGESITCIRDITMNKQPLIADLNILNGRQDLLNRSGIDLDRFLAHAQIIQEDKDFRGRLQQAHASDFAPCREVYQGIYSLGLIGRDEQTQRSKTRRLVREDNGAFYPAIVEMDPYELSTSQVKDGLRMFELSLRAKWSNFGDDVLSKGAYRAAELIEWSQYLDRCWAGPSDSKNKINLDGYAEAMREVRATFALSPVQEQALKELDEHVQVVTSVRETISKLAVDLQDTAEVENRISVDAGKVSTDRRMREIAAEASGSSITYS